MFCSQEEVVWRIGFSDASHEGVGETDNVEVLFLVQMCGHCGHQSHRWLSVKQDHEGQHANLSGKVLLQEQTHGDVLDLKTQELERLVQKDCTLTHC